MLHHKSWFTALFAVLALHIIAAQATVNVSENFTGASTENNWYYYGFACLTASSTPNTISSNGTVSHGPGIPPGCINDSVYNEPLVGGYNGTAGFTQSLPDPPGYGALRFTNGCTDSGCFTGGYNQNGAIISADTFSTNQGLDITFKTVTYRGNSYNNGHGFPQGRGDGADGMSFFLIDASKWSPNDTDATGSYGGSLGYSCSNTNAGETDPFHGMIGAYLGLGIDEFGNFLNQGDNTATGSGQYANRIGLRGAGSIAWQALNAAYGENPNDSTLPYYPSSMTTSCYISGGTYQSSSDNCKVVQKISYQQNGKTYYYYKTYYVPVDSVQAVLQACQTGNLFNYDPDGPATNAGAANLSNAGNTAGIMDYPQIPNASAVITNNIADEYANGGYSRVDATPITYRLKITSNGLLSLWYSYNGGSWIGVLQNQNISSSNAPLPPSLRFGFAGSSGGGTNIHELLCFKATPATQAQSSSTVNQQESSRVQNGTQEYFSYYDPSDWTGDLTAYSLIATSTGGLSIATAANWDASCVLSGVPSGSTCGSTGQTGSISPESPSTRAILTWSGTSGIPFEWSDLTTSEQNALDAGQTTSWGQDLLQYLRGDRSNEITPQATGLFRDRDSVLGDIVDSSPAWVGPPAKTVYSAYETPVTWQDKLYPTAVMPENSGQSYQQYTSAEASRLNVVYVGANDGLLHAFAAGNFNSNGSTFNNANNTGEEVLAYMPQSVVADIHNSTNANLDYSNPQYGHNFYVDASPGVGDLYYNGAWHTWLVSGLGAGGAEIFALDVTHPSQFSESNASSLVVGDWTPATLTCTNVSSCGSNLGNTYGTPVIRLLHNGDWGIIFGNGLGSTSGDAGIYVMTVNPTSEAISTYYLSTGQAGKSDGIAYAAPVDMDGDHIVDYVYAGDSNGNVWRFNLTSNDPTNWHASAAPIFTTPNGQPITSSVTPAFVTNPTTNQTQLMLYFGTGEKTALTNSSATSYQTGTQSFYGVWDWNLSVWNSHNLTQFTSLSSSAMMTTAGTSTDTLGIANLQQQIVSVDSSGNRNVTSTTPICWAGTLACGTTGNSQFGWYINLPGSNSAYNQTTYEQVVYNPEIVGTAVVFNSTLPGIDSPLACNTGADTGWTYAIDARSGGPVSNFFINNGNTHTIGYQSNASGTDSVVTTGGTGSSPVQYYLVYQTNTGQHNIQQITVQGTPIGLPETWIELR